MRYIELKILDFQRAHGVRSSVIIFVMFSFIGTSMAHGSKAWDSMATHRLWKALSRSMHTCSAKQPPTSPHSCSSALLRAAATAQICHGLYPFFWWKLRPWTPAGWVRVRAERGFGIHTGSGGSTWGGMWGYTQGYREVGMSRSGRGLRLGTGFGACGKRDDVVGSSTE